jgi:DNA-binding NarL/FixJ family response regulator
MQTILIVDDHPLFRAAIRDIVGRQFAAKDWPVGFREASSFQEAFDAASSIADLGLVTLDIVMADTSDLSGLLRFRAGLPTVPVVIISAIDDSATIRRALVCGAAGFIPKSLDLEAMVSALNVVLDGGISMPSDLQAAHPGDTGILRREERNELHETGVPLTPRQAAVLEKLVEGKSNKEIARQLSISAMTVKVHVTAILRSLGVLTRSQAIVAVRSERLTNRHSSGP